MESEIGREPGMAEMRHIWRIAPAVQHISRTKS